MKKITILTTALLLLVTLSISAQSFKEQVATMQRVMEKEMKSGMKHDKMKKKMEMKKEAGVEKDKM